jgi:hypothetical protein
MHLSEVFMEKGDTHPPGRLRGGIGKNNPVFHGLRGFGGPHELYFQVNVGGLIVLLRRNLSNEENKEYTACEKRCVTCHIYSLSD